MEISYQNIKIRNATIEDAKQLVSWWNDGKIMAHAGWPLGTGEREEDVITKIKKDNDLTHRRLIIELDKIPIGEMNYRNIGNKTAEIGIKICDFSKQNQGYGKIVLSMMIDCLFNDFRFEKIVLDTNLNNHRAQYVYEKLGFKKMRINENHWKDQLGNNQSSVDYELVQEDFVSFYKR